MLVVLNPSETPCWLKLVDGHPYYTYNMQGAWMSVPLLHEHPNLTEDSTSLATILTPDSPVVALTGVPLRWSKNLSYLRRLLNAVLHRG